MKYYNYGIAVYYNVNNYEQYNVEAYLVIKYHQDKNSKKYRLHKQNDIMCPVEQMTKNSVREVKS